MTDASLQNYYYGKQLKRYITQFMVIFSGLKVAVGKNDFHSQTKLIEVPITYGAKDRVVAAILAENTQNKPVRVPCLSVYMQGIDPAAEDRAGTGTVRKTAHLPLGAALPDGVVVVESYRPIPYRLNMELSLWASNTDQHCQMLEQILMLFDPALQIQTSDNYADGSKFTNVELDSIGFEQSYPEGVDRRVISTALSFSFLILLSPPYNLRKDYIKSIHLRLDAIANGEDVRDVVADVDVDDLADVLIDVDAEDIPEK
jgi:hypothetical protein